MNNVILLGRLTKDSEVRYTEAGKAVTKFTVAIDRRLSKEKKDADFINCVAFGKTAEAIGNYFNKGSRILITGSIRTGNYVDKNNVKRYTTDVWVSSFEFVDSKKQDGNGSSNTGAFESMGTVASYNDIESLAF